MVAQRYELFCSLICCATITFLHRYALCVYITHPTSGQRHFSCRYSDPASSIWGGHIIQESRGDRWCPRCESVVNEVVHVSACFCMFLQYFGEPSLPEGLFAGRHDRALAHAVPPAALPGLIPACGLAREVCCGLAREVWCGASAHAPTHRLFSGTRAKCRVPQACLGDKAGAR